MRIMINRKTPKIGLTSYLLQDLVQILDSNATWRRISDFNSTLQMKDELKPIQIFLDVSHSSSYEMK